MWEYDAKKVEKVRRRIKRQQWVNWWLETIFMLLAISAFIWLLFL